MNISIHNCSSDENSDRLQFSIRCIVDDIMIPEVALGLVFGVFMILRNNGLINVFPASVYRYILRIGR